MPGVDKKISFIDARSQKWRRSNKGMESRKQICRVNEKGDL
jgi:hypothetical protein